MYILKKLYDKVGIPKIREQTSNARKFLPEKNIILTTGNSIGLLDESAPRPRLIVYILTAFF